MRVETKLFLYLFVFFVPVTLMYGFWSKWEEPIGVTALILTALLFALSGFYLWMTGKKLPLRPEDNATGEIEDAEGNYGYFVASSWTPLCSPARARSCSPALRSAGGCSSSAPSSGSSPCACGCSSRSTASTPSEPRDGPHRGVVREPGRTARP